MWRVFSDSLPTKISLLKRRIDLDPVCIRCGEGLETVEHALRDCRWNVFFWRVSPIRLVVDNSTGQPLLSWIEDVCRNKEVEYKTIFSTLLWSIWFARNLLIFKEVEFPHSKCVEIAEKHRLQLQRDKHGEKRRETVGWRRPQRGWWKVNVDAAVKTNVGMGIGVIIRDETGEVKGSRFLFSHCSYPVDIAECLALREGLTAARLLLGEKVIFETNCQTVFNRIVKPLNDLSYLNILVSNILVGCAVFNAFEFCWVRRETNYMAHRLARFALASQSCGFVAGGLPAEV